MSTNAYLLALIIVTFAGISLGGVITYVVLWGMDNRTRLWCWFRGHTYNHCLVNARYDRCQRCGHLIQVV